MSDRAFPNMSQIPSALKRNPVENPFAYSREFMLNLFDLASGLDSLPDDVDPSLLCWMEEAREPLAMMPLSDTEKKLVGCALADARYPVLVYAR